jgi:hypothetical protein
MVIPDGRNIVGAGQTGKCLHGGAPVPIEPNLKGSMWASPAKTAMHRVLCRLVAMAAGEAAGGQRRGAETQRKTKRRTTELARTERRKSLWNLRWAGARKTGRLNRGGVSEERRTSIERKECGGLPTRRYAGIFPMRDARIVETRHEQRLDGSRREEALNLPECRWSGFMSAAARFLEGGFDHAWGRWSFGQVAAVGAEVSASERRAVARGSDGT